jgi:hypothetical protein
MRSTVTCEQSCQQKFCAVLGLERRVPGIGGVRERSSTLMEYISNHELFVQRLVSHNFPRENLRMHFDLENYLK